MHPQAVRVVAELGIRIRHEIGAHAAVERLPVGAGVGRLEDAAARHPDVQVLRVARIDEDRVELGPVRRAVLVAAAPLLAVRMLVEAGDARPGRAAVGRAEEPLRRRARVPDAELGRVARREPERVVDACACCPASNAGGVLASFHVRPRSVERNTVGPRWPVRAAASSVLPSRGSSTAWWTMLPRKCGPASFHVRRAASPVSVQSPLRVAISNTVVRAGRADGRLLVLSRCHDRPPDSVEPANATATAPPLQAPRSEPGGVEFAHETLRFSTIPCPTFQRKELQ